jgi:predicted lipid-binding transport protein (Tim44 family)
MYRQPRPFFGGLAGGIFLICLALAFMVHGSFFLPLLFVGLAFSALFGSLSSGKPQATYGGVMGFIWMLGLAAFFAFNFWWPGILILLGISAIAGTILRPMMNAQQQPYYQPSQQPQQPYYQPSQPPQQPEQPSYQPYQEGYQPQPEQETYQEGDKIYPYPQQRSSQEYEQPQAQYPQELPPQQ